VLHALIQHTVFHVSVFKEQTTQDYQINCAAVLCMVIMILCQHSKIVSNAHIRHVKLVQIAAPVLVALVIKVKTILVYCPTAPVLLNITQIYPYHLTAYVIILH
jgi:hypothetical protein